MSGLLADVRVLEATMLLADNVGMVLADWGADVVKIEPPGAGDYLRDILGQITPHHSPAHLQANKNKRSIILDLHTQEGRRILLDLVKTADVFIDGFIGGFFDDLGIGYAAQRLVNPGIIYCQCSGFGATGPYATIPAHGGMMMAMAGATPNGSDPDLDETPKVPDLLGGTASGGESTATIGAYLAGNVAAALYRRERTQRGCKLDGSGADAVIASGWIGCVYNLNADRVTDWQMLGEDFQRGGAAKYSAYRTADGKYVELAAIEPKFWDRLCRVVGREDLLGTLDDDCRVDFANDDVALRSELGALFAGRSLQDWLALAAEHGLPIGPVNRLSDLPSDPQIRTREILVHGEHPAAGPFIYVGTPVKIEDQPYRIRRPAPEHGEHTVEVLTALGLDATHIVELRADGIIGPDAR